MRFKIDSSLALLRPLAVRLSLPVEFQAVAQLLLGFVRYRAVGRRQFDGRRLPFLGLHKVAILSIRRSKRVTTVPMLPTV